MNVQQKSCRGCLDLSLILFLSLESEVRPIKCFNISSLCLFYAIECPVFEINQNEKKSFNSHEKDFH